MDAFDTGGHVPAAERHPKTIVGPSDAPLTERTSTQAYVSSVGISEPRSERSRHHNPVPLREGHKHSRTQLPRANTVIRALALILQNAARQGR